MINSRSICKQIYNLRTRFWFIFSPSFPVLVLFEGISRKNFKRVSNPSALILIYPIASSLEGATPQKSIFFLSRYRARVLIAFSSDFSNIPKMTFCVNFERLFGHPKLLRCVAFEYVSIDCLILSPSAISSSKKLRGRERECDEDKN